MEVAKEADEADQLAVKEMADAIRVEKIDERVYGSPKNQKGEISQTRTLIDFSLSVLRMQLDFFFFF